MKRHFYLFILVINILSMFGQKPESVIDSLKKSINKGSSINKFNTLIKLAEEYSNHNLEKASYYSRQALRQAQSMNSDIFLATAYNTIGNIHQYKSQLDSALIFHKKTLNIRLSAKDTIGFAESYNNIGIAFDCKGLYSDALQHYFKALFFFEKKHAVGSQAMVLTNIGIIYKAQKEYKRSLYYYKKSHELYNKTQDEFGKTASAGNLGSILNTIKQYRESLKYSELASKGYKKLGLTRYEMYPISNIACSLDSLHQFSLANKYYEEAIRLFEKYQNGYEVANISNLYAICLLKQKNFNKSILQSKKAIVYANKANASAIKIQAYANLSRAYTITRNFELANTFANLFNKGRDSLFAKEKTKVIFELETKYQTEKKEKLLLQKEAEAKQKNLYLIGLSVVMLLIFIIGFLIYRQQKLSNKQQVQEFELKAAIVKIENQNKLQEQRLSISRDLHDTIGAQLTFIISSVENIKYAFNIKNEKLDTKLSTIVSFAKETIVELRDTIWSMNSTEISLEDLEFRINNYILKAKEAKDQISFSSTIEPHLKAQKLSSVQGMNVYRTIQEAVNNSIKHANATVISINVKKIENQLKITIQDNGLGFDQDTVEKGNGLLNMKKRIEEIGGEFHLSSSNEGTRIEILLKKQLK